MILDAHVHVGKWDDPVLGHTSTTIKELERTLAEVGASGAVVTTSDRRENAGLLSEIARDGQLRYWPFPWVDPGEGATADLTFLQDNRAHIAGLKLH